MKSRQEKNWDLMNKVLAADANGHSVCFGSQQTLFGIKSHSEQVIERAAAEIDQQNVQKAQPAQTQKAANHEPVKCPVCGELTITEPYDICENCGWENDRHQCMNPFLENGANKMSLAQARAAWAAGQKVE